MPLFRELFLKKEEQILYPIHFNLRCALTEEAKKKKKKKPCLPYILFEQNTL